MSRTFPVAPLPATLRQVGRAHRQLRDFGETGEFTLAKGEGDEIVFLLRHRHLGEPNTLNPSPVGRKKMARRAKRKHIPKSYGYFWTLPRHRQVCQPQERQVALFSTRVS